MPRPLNRHPFSANTPPPPPPPHTHTHNISILTVGTVFFNAMYSWNAYSIIHSSQLYASNVIFFFRSNAIIYVFNFVSCSSLRRRNPLCQAPHCLQCIVRSALSRNSCHHLHCDNLFSSQPFSPLTTNTHKPYERSKSGMCAFVSVLLLLTGNKTKTSAVIKITFDEKCKLEMQLNSIFLSAEVLKLQKCKI